MRTAQIVSLAERSIAVDRGLRFKRMREHDVDRASILAEAVWVAAQTGYNVARDPLPNHLRDVERQKRWIKRQAEIPTAAFWKEFADAHRSPR